MKISLLRETMHDAIDRITMVRSYRVVNPERKSDNYRFIYLKIPMFFLFKGKTKDFTNRIEVGPCLFNRKFLLVIEWE